MVYTLYKQVVGSLMYLTSTRPDLMFVVNLLSWYMAPPTTLHLQAAKHVLRYVKGTLTLVCFIAKKRTTSLWDFSIVITQEM